MKNFNHSVNSANVKDVNKNDSFCITRTTHSSWYKLYLFTIWFVFLFLLFGSAVYEGGLKANNIPFGNGNSGQKQSDIKSPKKALNGNGIMFTENKGQIIDSEGKLRQDILFKGDGGGAEVYLRSTGISYVLMNNNEVMQIANAEVETMEESGKITEGEELPMKMELIEKSKIKTHRVDIDFVNCNSNYLVEADEKIGGYSNYYYPHCKDGITHVNSYNMVTQKNIYKNVDIKYYGGKTNGLKYDIIVNPGGNANEIKLKYSGAKNIQLYNGKLQVETSVGPLGEYMPKVYQIINGKEKIVNAEYVLDYSNGDSKSDATVSFKFGNYNPDYALIIDPWVTYYGGAGFEWGLSITTDALGNCIATGNTGSVNFPANAGGGYVVFQSGIGGSQDAFVVKFDALGTRLFATYVGGGTTDEGAGVSTDANNNIFFTGYTNSLNFPIGASGGNVVHQSVSGGGFETFLVKLDAAGNRLFITFYGGSGNDIAVDVCSDGNNIYLSGNTNSANNISTGGAFQPALSGSNDGFVAKFLANGTRIWGTYFGGPQGENICGITCDPSGNILFTGFTGSATFPLQNAFQPVYAGAQDAYIVKLSSSCALMWSTFYGGTSQDNGYAICTDAAGNVFIGGSSSSNGGIATAGAFQTALSSVAIDAFIAKFSSTGSRLWGTYLGGTAFDYCSGLGCDLTTGNIVGSGDTYSTNFPTTACAYQPSFIGSEDQWVTTLNPNGTALVCSSYIGVGNSSAPNNETYQGKGGSLAVYGCNAYLVAFSQCNYPITGNAWQSVCGGVFDANISQLSLLTCGLPTPNSIQFAASQNVVCVGQPVPFTSTVNVCNTAGLIYNWTFQGGIPATSSLQSPTVTYANPGTYSVALKIGYICGAQDSLIKFNYMTVIGNPTVSFPTGSYTNSCGGNNGIATASVAPAGVYTYSWSNGATTQTVNNLLPGIHSVTVTNSSGCQSTSTVQILITPVFSVTPTFTNVTSCIIPNGAMSATASIGGTFTYSWSSGQTTQLIGGLSGGVYTVIVTDANTGCIASQTVAVTINTVAPDISVIATNTMLSCGGSATLTGNSTTGGATFSWTPQNSINQSIVVGTTATPTLIVTDPATGCVSYTAINIASIPMFTANLSLVSNAKCFGDANGVMQVSMMGGGNGPFNITNLNSNNNIGSYSTFPVNVNGLAAGNYSIEVTDTNGCVSVLYLPITEPVALTIALNGNAVICEGQGTVINSILNGGTTPYNYMWLPLGSGFPNANLNPVTNTTYSLNVTDKNGCLISTNITITVNPKPAAKLLNTKFSGCAPACNTFSLTTPDYIGYSYNWMFTYNNAVTSPTTSSFYNPEICFYKAGTYNTSFTVTSAEGCTNSAQYNEIIEVFDKPMADFEISPDLVSILDPEVHFYNHSQGATSYKWYNVNTYFSKENNPTLVYSEIGKYLVTLIASNNQCSDTISKYVDVKDEFLIYVPNTFTPNDDNFNDTFYPVMSGFKTDGYTLMIFDRWGEKIFTTSDITSKGWDGTYKSKLCEEGVYVWKISVATLQGKGKELTGHVTLIK